MNTEDLALGYVLGSLEEQEDARVRDLLDRKDETLEAAIASARHDVKAVERGLTLVAEGAITTKAKAKARTPWAYRLVPVAASVLLFAVATATVLNRGDDPVVRDDDTTLGAPDGAGAESMDSRIAAPELKDMVAGADGIYVGTVTAVRTEKSEEMGSYSMATLRVTETIKGAARDEVVAFDYNLIGGDVVDPNAPAWATEGQELLVFLVPDMGTESENLEPAHFQVFHGDYGRFALENGELASAPWTLEQVRDAARAG